VASRPVSEVRLDLDGELELAQHFTIENGARRFAEQHRETYVASGWRSTT
jgi:hypothetical protein